MTAQSKKILVLLGAPPEIARDQLAEIVAQHTGQRITVYMRIADRSAYTDLLEHCFVYSDKPSRDKRRFVRELRGPFYDEAIVLDFGHWSFYPTRCLFFLSRAAVKTVRTERGAFPFSWRSPKVLLRHWMYRRKHRSGSIAGLPAGTPAPFVVAAYRKTLGLAIGIGLTVLEYCWRRLATR